MVFGEAFKSNVGCTKVPGVVKVKFADHALLVALELFFSFALYLYKVPGHSWEILIVIVGYVYGVEAPVTIDDVKEYCA